MRVQKIIEELQAATQFAAALMELAPLSVQPGAAADIAAVGHAAGRLSEKLGSIQRMIAREVLTMRGGLPATAGRNDEDVVAMLIKAQENRPGGEA